MFIIATAKVSTRARPDVREEAMHGTVFGGPKGYFGCSQLLIDFASTTPEKCRDCDPPLHLPASCGEHVTKCKLLLEHEAPPNASLSKKQTTLCLTAQKVYVKIVHMLVEHGTGPSTDDDRNNTPLHLAAW